MVFISALHLTISTITYAVHSFTSINGKDFPYVQITSCNNNNSNCLINSNNSGRTIILQREELSTRSFQLLASDKVSFTLAVQTVNKKIYV